MPSPVPKPTPSSADVGAGVPGGDWSALVARHQRAVVLSLLGLGLSWDKAAELANATWLKLMEAQRSGRLREIRLPGLAIAQARWLAFEERRQAARGYAGPQEAAPHLDGSAADESDPERRLLAREQAGLALAAIGAAPPTAQRVFQLVYGERGLSHAEAAAEVGLSTQRVRQIVCELRQKARAALEVPPRKESR